MKRYANSCGQGQNQVLRESKAYRLYETSSKKVVINRDVIFDEDAV